MDPVPWYEGYRVMRDRRSQVRGEALEERGSA